MKNKVFLTLSLLCFGILSSCAQPAEELTSNVEVDTIEDSNYILYYYLGDSLYNTIEGREIAKNKRAIKTEKQALELGQQAFSREFGKDFGLDGRRYLVHLLKGYWVVKGLLPVGYSGGTLVALFDAKSGDLITNVVWK